MSTINAAGSVDGVPASKADFDRFYDTDLLPELKAMETRRRLWALIVAGIVLAIDGPVVYFLWPLLFGGLESALFFIACLVIGYKAARAAFRRFGYRNAFKQKIVGKIAEFVFPGSWYDHQQHVSEWEFNEGGMFGDYCDFFGEDLFCGDIGKTNIRFSELRVRKRGRKNSRVVVFDGIYVVADFNKNFEGRTIVLPDTAEANLGWLGKKLQGWNIGRPGELVSLECQMFERNFVVYATDQVTARYILTPSLMERIVSLRSRFGSGFSLSFVNSRVHAAFSVNNDLFEPELFETMLDKNRYVEFCEDIKFFVGLVDELDLNLRIWSKQ